MNRRMKIPPILFFSQLNIDIDQVDANDLGVQA